MSVSVPCTQVFIADETINFTQNETLFSLGPFKKRSNLIVFDSIYLQGQLYTEKFHIFTQFKKFTLYSSKLSKPNF